MQLYFNPNAAPKTLYPIIPLLLAFDNDVTIWEPDPNHIEEYLNGDLWTGLIRHESYRQRLRFLYSTDRKKNYLTAGQGVIADTIRENLCPTRERTPEMKAEIRILSRTRWARLSDEAKQDLSSRMLHIRRDVESKNPEVLSRLLSGAEISTEFPIEWLLFDSIVQDVFMLMASGARTPLCEPARWLPYVAALEALEIVPNFTSGGSSSSNDVEDGFRIVMDQLDENPRQRSLDMEATRMAASFLDYTLHINKISFAEYEQRRGDCRKCALEFTQAVHEVMRSPILSGSRFSDRLLEMHEILEARKERIDSITNLLAALLTTGGAAMGYAATSEALRAAGVLIAGFGSAGQVMTNRFVLGRRLAQLGFKTGRANRSLRILLQRPGFWTSLLA